MDITNIKENMGNVDRVVRALLAVVFVAAFFNGLVTGVMGIALLVLSWVFIGSAIFGLCPLYRLIGLSTQSKQKHETGH